MNSPTLRELRTKIAPYEQANNLMALFSLFTTFAALAVSISLTAWLITVTSGVLLAAVTLLMAIPNGFLMVRLFVLVHDMCHGSFFSKKWMNHVVGVILSVPVVTPFFAWRRSHNIHHIESGKIEKSQHPGEIGAMKVSEYVKLSPLEKLMYKLKTHPLLLVTVNAWLLFLLLHRIPFESTYNEKGRPVGFKWSRPRDILSVMLTNIGLVLMFVGAWYFGFLAEFLLIYMPSIMVASSLGVWLFFVQHHYEDVYWEDRKSWSLKDAALKGASFYDLPKIIHWLTGNIGYHHIHHFSTKIPCYKLPKVFKDVPEINIMKRLSVWDSFKCTRYVLLDEQRKCLVSIKEAMAAHAAKTAPQAA